MAERTLDTMTKAPLLSAKKKGRALLLGAAILTIFFAVYFSLYFQNVPYECDGGLSGWISATQVSWPRLIGYVFNPVSPRATCGQGPTVIDVRVTESLVLKFLYGVFGDSVKPVAIYNVCVAVALALLVLLFVHRLTGSAWAGFFASAFLLATPAYGWCLMEYGDYSPSDQVLLLVYLFLFLREFETIAKDRAVKLDLKRLAGLGVLWLVGILAIRAKEPAKFLVPGISWLIVFLNPSMNIFTAGATRRRKGFLPLCAVLMLLSLPIVLVKHTLDRPMLRMKFLLDPFYMLFWNPRGWDAEETSALFSLKNGFPASIASSLGFALAWALIISALYLGHRWWRERGPKRSPALGVSSPLLLVVWAAIALAFSISFDTLPMTRYQTMTLLPVVLLASLVFVRALEKIPVKVATYGIVCLALLVSVKIAQNLKHSIYIRQELEGLWTPKWIIRGEVYKDALGEEKCPAFPVYEYFCTPGKMPANLPYYVWHHNDRRDLGKDKVFLELLNSQGKAYVGSNRPLELPWRSELIRELKASDFSLLTSFRLKFSGHPVPKFYLYKVFKQ